LHGLSQHNVKERLGRGEGCTIRTGEAFSSEIRARCLG